ncbi:hypothetical protein EYR38_005048 [Pleurotus pulmonarius]|nr:hypothetical protein EYR38_005048 [Pleurotus pulmonarius]
MSTLSDLPPELLRALSLYLRTSDCSNLSLTCWKINNAVVSVLFENVRILDEFLPTDLSHLFDKCPYIKSAARHVTLIQWDSDFVAATISTDIIYAGIASFPNITSLRLNINTMPYSCWMLRLHRLFLALKDKGINKLDVTIADCPDSNSKTMPSLWCNPPIPYYCLSGIKALRVTIATRTYHEWRWLEYIKELILASKETLTAFALGNFINVNMTKSQTPLFQVLRQLKQLETLEFSCFPSSPPITPDKWLPLVQPDACPKLRRIACAQAAPHQTPPRQTLIDVARKPNSEAVLSCPSPTPPMPWEFTPQPSKEYTCLVSEDLSPLGDPDDLEYSPSSSASSSSDSDYDSDFMSE